MDSNQIHAGFVRVRRFLIAVSVGLACVDVLGLRFDELSILGNTARLEHPERVVLLLYVVWAWALVQYLVWFKDVRALHDLRQAVNSHCELALGKSVASEPIPEWLTSQLKNAVLQQSGEYRATVVNAVRYQCSYARMHGDGKHRDRAADIEATGYVRLPEQKGEVTAGPIRFERVITPGEWRRQQMTSWPLVLLTTRFVPEYFAPFVIAILPLAVATLHSALPHARSCAHSPASSCFL